MSAARIIGAALAAFVAAGTAALKSTPGQTPQEQVQRQRVTLPSGISIDVSRAWVQREPTLLPPSPWLAPFAPRVTFLDFAALENPDTYSALRIATTSNAFLGQDEVALDAQMHSPAGSGNSLIDYLFYFFFPPPRDCLDGGAEAYSKARSLADQNSTAADLSIRTDCRHAATVADFYSSQLSRGVMFQVTNFAEKAGGIFPQFYLLPMEKLEANGLTFYVFEAQGQTQLDLAAVNYFNLPDDLQDAQTDFFWAVGAPTPFPFSLDPQRKNVPVIQVAYAGIGLGPNKRENFMRLLQQVYSPGESINGSDPIYDAWIPGRFPKQDRIGRI